jgi:RNA polymerase sigma factor (sigma-70 family)
MNQSKILSEAEFIEGLRQDNRQIMNRLYKVHFPMVLHFVNSNNGTEDEAKDIYQEAFIILYENLQKTDFQLSCKIKTYIYSVCRRLWLKNLYIKSKFLSKIEDFEDFIIFEEERTDDNNEIAFGQMEEALRKLGEPCRTILEDYYLNKLTMHQIAEKMAYTNADNAKTQKYKCLNRLKKLMT